ncbi:MAG: cell division ATP-binding protein FtsE [Nitrospirae bacterium CG_4_10_14_3_um_filter_44_29]|nr:cell division ATP-binding protein FtsE [Nitrospirota bacterium]OIO28907.1 MAG: cell division ATP-binding protein FtsE [Nitrospirae bacterium CG1_02_44_142]PIP70102.1 MAG: cell division ATP-binding protein FtsE [Nitrospirae bacterium CG22_combo_CG10-13_8_21_14_all_44_11]PIV43003.1 MAG: cell division ATP-binding protein FtsE [Nitrospirae bacterium CG02_land_8_20_14_3_00_44_33]PIV67126.1 MAG: cell division ATP-binding protein FtsE [Nitrospirae bacterium CG01_land_8_20_14_3_00_44_22]PIW89354.1 
MIHFSNVTKFYEKQAAVKNITFSVEKGEMVFMTGPSGAGKSTLLKIIYLSEKPDEGSVTIAEWDLSKIKESSIPFLRRNIGVVFQDFRLLDNRNVFDNVAIALRIRGMLDGEIQEWVMEILKMVNLRHKADSFPLALSGGEQQRVVIARAIVGEPTILLADEPTGNLDSDTAAGITRLFKEINARGTTVVIATHNKELYRNTGRRVFRLDGGNMVGEELG